MPRARTACCLAALAFAAPPACGNADEDAAPLGTDTDAAAAIETATETESGAAADGAEPDDASTGVDAPRAIGDAGDERTEPGAICVGYGTACAVRGQTLKCWGSNSDGELGQGAPDDVAHPTPVSVPGVSPERCAVGLVHVCAVTGGRVACWGNDAFGQLGHDPTLDDAGLACGSYVAGPPCVASPTAAPGIDGVAEISAGEFHVCALDADAGVYCWGEDAYGQSGVADAGVLRDGGLPSIAEPRFVMGGAAQVANGYMSTCALRASDGTVWCWGFADFGQLGTGGQGDPEAHPTPTEVSWISGVRQIAAGGWHVCALVSESDVRCWGDNALGQLGHRPGDLDTVCASSRPCRTLPAAVPGLGKVRELALGETHTCAVTQDDRLVCWGLNGYGQLGHDPAVEADAGLYYSWTPTPVPGLENVAHAAATSGSTCAVQWDGTVLCWGEGDRGQTGAPMDAGPDARPAWIPRNVGGL